MKYDITTLPTLAAYVSRVTQQLITETRGATVLGLIGDLGTGKTTFTQLLARELGVTEMVVSPTFLVMRSYETKHPHLTTLVHMDAYRIEDERELGPLRFSELLRNPHTILVVEWADRIKASLPPDTRFLYFTLAADGTRSVNSEGESSGERGET